MLLEKPTEVVTREELRKRLWPADTFVDFDHGLNNAINRLREALNDSADAPRFIETLPRRGYRFIAQIENLPTVSSSGTPTLPVTAFAQESASTPVEPANVESPGSSRLTVVPLSWPRKVLWLGVTGIAVLMSLVFALNLNGWRNKLLLRSAPHSIRSIAVLPFTNLSGDPSQDYLADGMSDELTTFLARVPSLRVISRTSTLQYRSPKKPLKQIAHELNVDAVIEGSIVRSGDHVRVTAQLIDANIDRHIWADTYDRNSTDILSAQSTAALEIAYQVRNRLAASGPRMDERVSVNSAAYDSYLLGRYALTRQDVQALKEGLAAFQQASKLDPTYGPAYSGVADSWSLLANFQAVTPSEAFPQAEAAARKSLQLDPSLAEAHASLGFALHHYDWNWAASEREYQAAIALSPSYSTAHLRYAELLSTLGRHDEAVAEIQRAQELDPNSLLLAGNLGRVLYHARRYDEAIEVLSKTLQVDPGRVYVRMHLGMCYEEKGMYAEALDEFNRVDAPFGRVTGPDVARTLAKSGRAGEARQIAKRLQNQALDSDWFFLAGVYGALGDREAAFRALQKAHEKHDFFLVFLRVHPYMDSLRSDPRYTEMLREIGLR
jgi:TolB-like protein/DNA-binding winged helix-turn-helix (wHTH) protein/Tfp pilus assembly protein PilF